MISSVANSANPLSGNLLGRAGQAVAQQGAAVARAEEAALRAIDRVAGGHERMGIEQSLRQDDLADAADQDLADDAASLIEKKAALRANVAVLKTADRMVGTLLDLFA